MTTARELLRVTTMEPDAPLEVIRGFQTLSEYECVRAQIAIEWVARSAKPIVEIGGRVISECDIGRLADDLDRCITLSGELVQAFIIQDKVPDYCCYGFFRHPWVINALLCAWGVRPLDADPDDSLWLQGLVFGYSPDAIQQFISSAQRGRESKSPPSPCSAPYRHRKVEMYGPAVLSALSRSNSSDRCRKSD